MASGNNIYISPNHRVAGLSDKPRLEKSREINIAISGQRGNENKEKESTI